MIGRMKIKIFFPEDFRSQCNCRKWLTRAEARGELVWEETQTQPLRHIRSMFGDGWINNYYDL